LLGDKPDLTAEENRHWYHRKEPEAKSPIRVILVLSIKVL